MHEKSSKKTGGLAYVSGLMMFQTMMREMLSELRTTMSEDATNGKKLTRVGRATEA